MQSRRSLRDGLVCVAVLVATAAGARAEPPDPGWKLSWWPKLEVESPDGAHKIRFGGRLLLDGAVIRYDQDLQRRKSPAAWTRRSEVRQGRIYTNGVYFDRLELKAEADFAPDNPALTDAYLGIRDLGPLGTARFGHQKIPFSLEQQISRLNLTFMERSLANTLDPSTRDMGLKLFNTHLDGRLRWAVGGFRDTNLTGVSFNDDHNWNAGARITGLPLWREGGRKLLHLGASYNHGFRDSSTVSISRSPESFVANKLVATGTVRNTRDVDRFGVEAAWVHGPLSLQAEWNHALIGRRGGTLDLWGWYAMASWFVTGEHRRYSKSNGAFGSVVPKAAFDPANGGWGALQLAFRVSGVDLNDRDVRGGVQTDFGFAANWYPHTNLRFGVNYIRAHVNGQGDADVLQGRIWIHY